MPLPDGKPTTFEVIAYLLDNHTSAVALALGMLARAPIEEVRAELRTHFPEEDRGGTLADWQECPLCGGTDIHEMGGRLVKGVDHQEGCPVA